MNADELNRLINEEKRICRLCKDDLAAKIPSSAAEKTAFISAMIFSCGTLIIRNHKLGFTVTAKSEQVKKTVAAALNGLGVSPEITASGKGCKITVADCAELLVKCKVVTGEGNVVCDRVDESFCLSPSAASAYMRGAFLGSGSLSAPEYHLEFQFGKMSIAKDFCALTSRYGFKTEVAVNRGKAVVYCKDSGHISDALAFMGGVKSVLGLNSIIAARQMNAHLNRVQNCDMYNIDRQVNTGIVQCRYLKELDVNMLTPELRQTAEARLSHPDYSYTQLADILGITKSGLKNRLRRLKAIYNEINGNSPRENENDI